MYKPILSAFAYALEELDFIVHFTYVGKQVFKNRVIIRECDSDAIAYDKVLTTMKFEHIIPAYSLTNGTKYYIQLQVFDVNDEASPLSDKFLFACFSVPIVELDVQNTNENIVETPNAYLTLCYAQNNNELLNEYNFMLYSETKQLLNRTEIFYVSERPDTIYNFQSLNNNTGYYVRATGVTVNGIKIDTGYKYIFVKYIVPPVYNLLYLENHKNEGYIKYWSNIQLIGYTTSHAVDTLVYDENNEIIDLEEKWIEYNSGFNIKDNFTLGIRGKDFTMDKTFLEMSNNINSIKLKLINISGNYYFKLNATNALGNYQVYKKVSNDVLITNSNDFLTDENGNEIELIGTDLAEKLVTLWIRRINNIYNLEIILNEI